MDVYLRFRFGCGMDLFATFSAFRIKKSVQLFFNSRKSAIFAPDFAFDFDRRERSLRGVIK